MDINEQEWSLIKMLCDSYLVNANNFDRHKYNRDKIRNAKNLLNKANTVLLTNYDPDITTN